jgi:hypothetical protein
VLGSKQSPPTTPLHTGIVTFVTNPVEKGIYDIDSFQIRFFTEKELQDLASAEGFEILWIKEEHEEPVTVYLVSSRKTL